MKLAKHHGVKETSLAPVSRTFMPFWPWRRLHNEMDRLLEDPFGGWVAGNYWNIQINLLFL